MNDQRNIEEKLRCYAALDQAEREDLEKCVRDCPGWLGQLEEAKRRDAFLSSARSLNDPGADEETMAYAATVACLAGSVVPEDLSSPLARMRRRIEADPERKLLFDTYQRRIAELESETDAVSHFEAVTGHGVSHEPIFTSGDEKPGSPSRSVRRPQARLNRAPVRRGIKLGSAVLLGLYLALFSFSFLRESESESDRLSHILGDDLHWADLGVSTRGNDPAWERQLTVRYEAALNEAARAKRSVLGLFPSYDFERVGRARILLEDTILIQERLERAPASAYLLLAKLNWLMHDSLATRRALISALNHGGTAAERAREFLDSL